MTLSACSVRTLAVPLLALVLVASSAAPAFAQTPPVAGVPFTAYGTGQAPGAVIAWTLAGVVCGSTVVNAQGQWLLQIAPTTTCAVSEGRTVGFTVNGRGATQTIVFIPGGAPPNRAAGLALTVPAAPPTITYVVRPGDTLFRIAARHGTTVTAIARANNIANPNLIRVGQVLRIPTTTGPVPTVPPPAPRTYVVRPGDTLSAIAARHGTTVTAIARANNIANPNLIRAGQVLRIL